MLNDSRCITLRIKTLADLNERITKWYEATIYRNSYHQTRTDQQYTHARISYTSISTNVKFDTYVG